MTDPARTSTMPAAFVAFRRLVGYLVAAAALLVATVATTVGTTAGWMAALTILVLADISAPRWTATLRARR